jgi:hypothetical protein
VSGDLLGILACPKELLEGGLSVSLMREEEEPDRYGACCGCWPKVAQKIVRAVEGRDETENGNRSDRHTGVQIL